MLAEVMVGVIIIVMALYATLALLALVMILEMAYAMYVSNKTTSTRSAFSASLYELVYYLELGGTNSELNRFVVPKSVALVSALVRQFRMTMVRISGQNGEQAIWEAITTSTRGYLSKCLKEAPLGTVVWLGPGYGRHVQDELLSAKSKAALVMVDTPEVLRVRAAVISAKDKSRPIHVPYLFTGGGLPPVGGMHDDLAREVPVAEDHVVFVGGFTSCGIATQMDFFATALAMRAMAHEAHANGSLVLPLTHNVATAPNICLFTYAMLAGKNVETCAVETVIEKAKELLEDTQLSVTIETIGTISMLIVGYEHPQPVPETNEDDGKGVASAD